MRQLKQNSSLLVIPMVVGLAACGEDESNSPQQLPAANTIVDVALEAGSFETLTSALMATGLDEILRGEGPFTVFAPTDEAFARLPDGVLAGLDSQTLAEILTYHVVGANVPAADVVGLSSASTVQGSDVAIAGAGGAVILNGATQVTSTDIVADNGIIHVIDSVLLPPAINFPGDMVDGVLAYPTFDTLVGAVSSADLADALRGDNGGDGFTLFAPTDAAFEALDGDLADLSVAELKNVLLYHVVGDTVNAASVVGLDSATTLEGSSVTISVNGGSVVLDGGATVTWTDMIVNNGIIHIIDGVLLP